jgi:hypothetical protein
MDGIDLSMYPGGSIVAEGLADLAAEELTEAGLVVLLARPRLADLGFEIPVPAGTPMECDHALFTALEERLGAGAHAAYNALIQSVVSFANSYEPGAKT